MSDRATLKAFFNTGDFPTEAQFADLIDSMPNIDDDAIELGTQDGLTALAGGGQAGATLINARLNRFTTVASIGDSGILQPAIAGNIIRVNNSGANSMDVFPAVGEQIDNLGVDSATQLFSGSGATFYCYTTGRWRRF